MLRTDLKQFLNKALRTIFLKLIGNTRARRRQLSMVFGKQGDAFSHAGLVRAFKNPKDQELLAQITMIKPSVIAVYGTGIVPDAVL
jgi:hypothetical protein